MKKAIFIFEVLKERLYEADFKETYRTQRNFFIRERTLNFVSVVMTLINNISKSLSVEVNKFLQRLGSGLVASKQAFSQARYKLRHEAFIDLNDHFVRAFYGSGDYRLLNGKYLLLCSDGSDYELPWSEGLVEAFGTADNKQNKQPMCMAKGVKIWDALNQVNVSAVLGRHCTAEMHLFREAWDKALLLLDEVVDERLLLLGDMYYPSFWLMLLLQRGGRDFLFRCRPDFCREVKAFMAGGEGEAILEIALLHDKDRKCQLKKTGIEDIPEVLRVRAVRVPRPNGVLSCLLTSVPPSELDLQAVMELYPERWTEEVSFNFDKNRVEVENFSAKMPEGIRQEWHAAILCANMTQLIVEDAQQELDKELAGRPKNKYRYQINRSVAYGLVKDEFPKMLFGKEPPAYFHARMVRLVLPHREPVRPGRSFPRKRKHRLKYSMNLRRVV